MNTKKEQGPRSAENGSEFCRGAKGTRLIHTAFHSLIKDTKDARMAGRLTAKFVQIIQSDPIHDRGERVIEAGDLTLLEGFDFCIKQQLQRTLTVYPEVLVDRKHNDCIIHFPVFTPQEELNGYSGFSHFRIVAAAAELDFSKERFVCHSATDIPHPAEESLLLTLSTGLSPASLLPIVVVVGIQLFKKVNGKFYQSKPGGHNPLQIVKVDPPALKLRRMKPKL